MGQKLKLVLLFILVILLLYSFICTLSLITISFKLLSSRFPAGSILAKASLDNPILGLMMGVVSTAIIQSSSATTSVVVALVASGTITIHQGIPVIMGTNVGTSVTSTLISLSNIKKTDEYELGFSAAILHDLYNWLTVLILLPLDQMTHLLENISSGVLSHYTIKNIPSNTTYKLGLLHVILDPIVHKIVMLKYKTHNCAGMDNMTLVESSEERDYSSEERDYSSEDSDNSSEEEDISSEEEYDLPPPTLLSHSYSSDYCTILDTDCDEECSYLFYNTSLSDEEIGGIILFVSVLVFIISYMMLFKTMQTILRQPMAKLSNDFFGKDLPYIPWFTNYIFLLMGVLVTILIQSSSIVTAALVPLVASKVITLERAYPITLGSNLGTTATGIAASLTSSSTEGLQLALCHLFFNLFGVAIYFVLPFMRWPLFIAKKFGSKVVKYKWFSIFYLLVSFILLPMIIYVSSLTNLIFLYVLVTLFCLLVVLVVIINYLQETRPQVLPYVLKDWKWLPKQMRTLATIDYIVQTYMEVFCCCIVSRTVTVVPMIGGTFTKKKLFGQGDMQMVKIEK